MALEKFCFCCKLQNGAFIWGVFCIIYYLIVLITTISLDIHYKTFETQLLWVIYSISTIHLISSILLVIGVVKKNHFMMLPWIIVTGITLIPLVIVAFLCSIVAIPIYGPIYIWWCMCSAYQKLQANLPTEYVYFHSFPLASPLDSDLRPLDKGF